MIPLTVILGIALIVPIAQCIRWNSKYEYEIYDIGVWRGYLITVLFVIEMGCIYEIESQPQPKAMDVYQGKTTLEYTIRDGVKVDSIVVFKKNYDEK